MLLNKGREALACIFQYSPSIFEHLTSRSPVGKLGTKLMIDGRKCHLLDPVVQRKDDLTDGEAYPMDKTANQLKTEPLHETQMATE